MVKPMRCGFVALIGAPNAGKSTLLNMLVGEKLSIVTHKVQTTRTRLRGIVIDGNSQIIFVDTPGIFAPRHALDEAMVHDAWAGVGDADIVVLLVDAVSGLTEDVHRILGQLSGLEGPRLLALNKIDRVPRKSLLGLTDALLKECNFDEVFMISALNGDGVGDLRDTIASGLPEGPWLYPEDALTDVTERELAAEITREQVLLRLHQELPYAIFVETESWMEQDDGSLRIEQVIHVERDNQKGIVIGRKGQTLKAIGAEARKQMEAVFERKVHLFLFVKVSEKWRSNRMLLAEMGYQL